MNKNKKVCENFFKESYINHTKNGGDNMVNKSKEIIDALGEVPFLFQELEFDESAHDALWEIFNRYELGETNIPGKYRHLIGLAVASAIRCQYCIPFHTESARLNGATEDEIKEASLMALTVSAFSTFINGRQVPMDDFKAQLKRIGDYLQKKAA